jgi:hypothetical protein
MRLARKAEPKKLDNSSVRFQSGDQPLIFFGSNSSWRATLKLFCKINLLFCDGIAKHSNKPDLILYSTIISLYQPWKSPFLKLVHHCTCNFQGMAMKLCRQKLYAIWKIFTGLKSFLIVIFLKCWLWYTLRTVTESKQSYHCQQVKIWGQYKTSNSIRGF